MAFDLKNYEPVEDRIARFYKEHPDGRIVADLVYRDEKQYIVRAWIYRDHDPATLPWATGLAEEMIGSTPVNRTSALENCETSAIGRALANAGYAPKGKRASREEMAKTTRPQPVPREAAAMADPPDGQYATPKQITLLWTLIRERDAAAEVGKPWEDALRLMLQRLGKESTKELSRGDVSQLIERLKNNQSLAEGDAADSTLVLS